ncbi:MAG: hypothetical protein IAF38_10425 [Bacteroidia bacterium]|nr:hypothetical protein [Bacteroidia bacterium]
MKFYLILSFFAVGFAFAQVGPGIGIYPTGTETGFGFRLNKEKRVTLDARIVKANFARHPATSSFLTELSGICRIVHLEKVRFHLGVGFRTEWNLSATHKYGVVIPLGAEAFPFPFQNAGLFFEAAPYYVTDQKSNWNGGIRTVAGFVFYFLKKPVAAKSPT